MKRKEYCLSFYYRDYRELTFTTDRLLFGQDLWETAKREIMSQGFLFDPDEIEVTAAQLILDQYHYEMRVSYTVSFCRLEEVVIYGEASDGDIWKDSFETVCDQGFYLALIDNHQVTPL